MAIEKLLQSLGCVQTKNHSFYERKQDSCCLNLNIVYKPIFQETFNKK